MKTKICKYCKFCKRFYRRNVCWFYRYNGYYCTAKEEETKRENVCELWQKNKAEYDLSAERFDQVENDIRFLIEFVDNMSK